jgi:hypothetical protein
VSSPRESVRRGRGRPSKLKPTEEFEFLVAFETGLIVGFVFGWVWFGIAHP